MEIGYLQNKDTSIWNCVASSGFPWPQHVYRRQERYVNKRQPSVCCWQHLTTTVDVASATNRRLTIDHTRRPAVYSAMVDWTGGSDTRVHRRQYTCYLLYCKSGI